MENYEDLIDTTVEVEEGKEKIKKGLIVAIEEGIGITIVDAFNKYEYLFCLIGPNSPKWIDSENWDKEAINKSFWEAIKMIKNGRLCIRDLKIFYYKEMGKVYEDGLDFSYASSETCAFNT